MERRVKTLCISLHFSVCSYSVNVINIHFSCVMKASLCHSLTLLLHFVGILIR